MAMFTVDISSNSQRHISLLLGRAGGQDLWGILGKEFMAILKGSSLVFLISPYPE